MFVYVCIYLYIYICAYIYIYIYAYITIYMDTYYEYNENHSARGSAASSLLLHHTKIQDLSYH